MGRSMNPLPTRGVIQLASRDYTLASFHHLTSAGGWVANQAMVTVKDFPIVPARLGGIDQDKKCIAANSSSVCSVDYRTPC